MNGFHVCELVNINLIELLVCRLIRIYISLCVRLIYERLVLSHMNKCVLCYVCANMLCINSKTSIDDKVWNVNVIQHCIHENVFIMDY